MHQHQPHPRSFSWAILPATQALFDKQKVSMHDAMLYMGKYGGRCTMLIVERENGNGKTTQMMLSSAGEMKPDVGSVHLAHHDQTFRSYGDLRVLAVIPYEVLDGKVVLDDRTSVNLADKFPLFVFK